MNRPNAFQKYLARKAAVIQPNKHDNSDQSLQIVITDDKDNKKATKQTTLQTFMKRQTKKDQKSNDQLIINQNSIKQNCEDLYNKSQALSKKNNDPLSSINFRVDKMSAPILQPYKKQAQILQYQKTSNKPIKAETQTKKAQPTKISQYKTHIIKHASGAQTPIYKYMQDSNKLCKQSDNSLLAKDYYNYSYNYQLPKYPRQRNSTGSSFLQQMKQRGRKQRRAKKQKQRQQKKALAQKKKKQYEQQQMKGFTAFMDYVLVDKNKSKKKKQQDQLNDKLKNLQMHNNSMLDEQKIEDNNRQNQRKINNGLIYKRQEILQEKIPKAFLRILLSFKFTTNFLIPQSKKVPNIFSDQLLYKKTFHYLVTNQCLADLHLRMKKVQQSSNIEGIPLVIQQYSKNSDGFVRLLMTQISNRHQQDNKKQDFLLKNLWLSRNRIGIVSNLRKFDLQHYGLPSKNNQKYFGFICFLETPQNKQQLSGPVKGLASFQVQQLDMIIQLTKSKQAYFYDLEKISTHIRQYLAITNLYDTQLAPLIYNPQLIDKKQYEIIQKRQRQQLQPILQRLSQQYNKTQYESIRQMVLRDQGIVLLQGPPGTGKTTTLMGLLAAQYHYLKFVCTYQQNRKILICAPSNAAIDHITKRLACQGLASVDGCIVFPNILRVGIVQTQDPDIRKVSLDDICDRKVLSAKQNITKKNNMTTIQVKQKIISLNKQINQIQAKNRVNPHFDNQCKVKRIKQQVREYESMLFNFRKEKIQLKQLIMQEQKKLFDQADIILTTLSSSGSQKMDRLKGYFGCLIVDEAAQSTQPNLLIPLQSFVKKVLLIGDPCQLPSTTLSQDSQITLFNRSLFQRFIDAGVKPYFLNIQYRMAPPIRQFASNTFYDSRLLDDATITSRYDKINKKNKSPKQQNSESKPMSPLYKICKFIDRNSFFVDVKYGQEQFHMNSYRNVGEASVVSYLIYKFMKYTKLTIGVITPYQSQRKYLLKGLMKDIQHEKKRKKIDQNNKKKTQEQSTENPYKNQSKQTKAENGKQQKKSQQNKKTNDDDDNPMNRIMINTVDSFQGQQKDIIIMSTVRANNKKDIGFMKDQRRINVALTRSRHLLIVVGHGDTLGSNQTWDKLLSWHQQRKTYYSIYNRDNLKQIYYEIENNKYQQKVDRKIYDKKSRDWRKLQRNEIKGSDFGLGMPKKKVKRQQKKSIHQRFGQKAPESNHNNNDPQNILAQQKQNQEIIQNAPIIQQNNLNYQQQAMIDDKLIQQKRQRQNQAVKIQQINRRLKQLESKMAKQNSAFAQLFK